MRYKKKKKKDKYFNENLCGSAQKELHAGESPSPWVVIRMPNNLVGTGGVRPAEAAVCHFECGRGVMSASFALI